MPSLSPARPLSLSHGYCPTTRDGRAQQRESTPLIRFARNSGMNTTGGGINDRISDEAEPAARRNANVRMNVVDDGVRGMNASRFGLLLMTLVSKAFT